MKSQLEPKVSDNLLKEKVKTFFLLSQRKKAIEAQTKKLSDQIKEVVVANHTLNPGQTHREVHGNYTLELQMKQRKVQVDDCALEQLLADKGLLDNDCYKRVLDHSWIEQLYINGRLTDEDLRSIYGGSQIIPTLIVEEGEDNVQGQDNSSSEQSGDGALHDRAHSEAAEEISGDNQSMGTT